MVLNSVNNVIIHKYLNAKHNLTDVRTQVNDPTFEVILELWTNQRVKWYFADIFLATRASVSFANSFMDGLWKGKSFERALL
jgi:hypothetical protein